MLTRAIGSVNNGVTVGQLTNHSTDQPLRTLRGVVHGDELVRAFRRGGSHFEEGCLCKR